MSVIGSREKNSLGRIRIGEQIHQFAASGYRAQRITVRNRFAVDREVRRDSGHRGVSAECMAETSFHLVEDQNEPILGRKPS
jgi:hypothetical protein